MKRRHFVKAGVGVAAALPALRGRRQRREGADPHRIPRRDVLPRADKIKLAMTSPDWEFVGVCEDSAAGRRTCAELGESHLRGRTVSAGPRRGGGIGRARSRRGRPARLKAGKHVHLEKPPAVRPAAMQEVVALARQKKLLLQTGFMWRYHPGFRAVFEAVRRGWLGEVFLVRGFIGNRLAPQRRPEWAEFPGGAMFELGSHLIDAAVRLLGKPRAVTSVLRRQGAFDDALKDNNVAVLEYDRATAVLVNTALQPTATPERSFEVLGADGTATLAPLEPPGMTIDLARPAGPYRKGLQRVALPAYRRYEADFAELAAAVRGDGALSVSLDEELLVAETVLRVSGMM